MRLGRPLASVDMPNILCGPFFEGLLADPVEKAKVLWDADKTLRNFYLMIHNDNEGVRRESETGIRLPRKGDRDLPVDSVLHSPAGP